MSGVLLFSAHEPCPSCGCPGEQYDGHVCEDFVRIMGADSARAVGRFRPEGIEGYRAASAPDAPLRATRAAAVEDERAWLDA